MLARKVLVETCIEKPKGEIGRTRFSMKLQDGRSTFHSNKCCPSTNKCRKSLLPVTAAPSTRIWLLQAQLPLLLLFAGLQRPTVSSQVGHHWGGGLCGINASREWSPGDLSMTLGTVGSGFIQTGYVLLAKSMENNYLKLWNSLVYKPDMDARGMALFSGLSTKLK